MARLAAEREGQVNPHEEPRDNKVHISCVCSLAMACNHW